MNFREASQSRSRGLEVNEDRFPRGSQRFKPKAARHPRMGTSTVDATPPTGSASAGAVHFLFQVNHKEHRVDLRQGVMPLNTNT